MEVTHKFTVKRRKMSETESEKNTFPEGLAQSLNILPPEENLLQDSEIQKSFRARLRTFIEGQKWVRRPLMLAPSVCAQYGWRCASNQLLECDTCSAKLSAAQPKVQSYQAYKACIEDIRDCLKTAHKKYCCWPLTPCPVSYVRMVPMHKEEALKKFKRRLEPLLTLESDLPKIKDGILQKLGLTEEESSALCQLSQIENSELNATRVILATTGWRREYESKHKKCLSCHSCQRMVALLLYVSSSGSTVNAILDVSADDGTETEPSTSYDREESNTKSDTDEKEIENSEDIEKTKEETADDSEMPSKRIKLSKEPVSDFDPLSEHRPWCPWVIESGVRESNSSMDEFCTPSGIWMPGWKLFLKCLLRNTRCPKATSHLRTSPLKEQLDNAQNMLESWNSST